MAKDHEYFLFWWHLMRFETIRGQSSGFFLEHFDAETRVT